ncbi:MAG: ion channel [Chloroflexota bacterium]|nr:ion channel [Chloroflexota bacterium]
MRISLHYPQELRQILITMGQRNIRLLLAAASIMLLLSAAATYLAERSSNPDLSSFGDCLWWAIVTMSTVGYGDRSPITSTGRLIASVVMITGPVLLVTLVSAVGVSVYEQRRKGMRGEAQIITKGHIVICGWNRKAKDIINELRLSPKFRDIPITIIDDSIETAPLNEKNIFFVRGNPCEISVLDQANVREAKYAIVIASDNTPAADQKTVLAVLAIESIHPDILTCAELNDTDNEGHLRRAACDVIVNTNALTSKLLAMSVENPATNSVLGELVTRTRGNEIYRMSLPQQYEGTSFQIPFEDLKNQHNITLIGLEREGVCILNPMSDFTLQSGDQLMVLCTSSPMLE